MPGDVLRRNSGSTPRESFAIALHLGAGELSLGMSIEIRTVAIEREHDQQFRIHARGGDLRSREPLDC